MVETALAPAQEVSCKAGGERTDAAVEPQVDAAPAVKKPKQRLVGLDMFRGLTMVVMLIVDYNGEAIPSIGHAPWNGIHLADFVMPFFLFISGISMSISLRIPPGGSGKKIFMGVLPRAVRLFLVGLVIQGSVLGVSELGNPSLSLDFSTLRIMGILQRIALALVVVAATELLVPSIARGQSGETLLPTSGNAQLGIGLWIFYESALKWLVVFAFLALQIILTYAVTPPASWPGCSSKPLFRCDSTGCHLPTPIDAQQLQQMGCSGVGWVDSKILGIHHVYIKGSNMGPEGPVDFGFDPEGLATSWGAIFTMFFGLHVGRVFKELKTPKLVLRHWALLVVPCMALGCILDAFGCHFNKNLWSPSYNIFMVGAATAVYALFYVLCDAVTETAPPAMQTASYVCKTALAPLQWLGANCILFFVMSDCGGVLTWLVQIPSWGQPHSQNNLVYFWNETVLGSWFGLASGCTNGESCVPVLLTYTAVEIVMWMAICGYLYRKGIFWKI